MPDNAGRDPVDVAATLSAWLATSFPRAPTRSSPTSTRRPPTGSPTRPSSAGRPGRTTGGRTERRLVVRVPPTRHLLFLDADFSTQYRVMKALADGGTGVPLPPLGWYEEDPAGSACPSSPWTTSTGWSPRTTCPTPWRGGCSRPRPITRTGCGGAGWRPWPGPPGRLAGPGPRLAGRPAAGRPGLDQQLAYYRDFLEWSAKGRPQPVAEATWDWLVDHRPTRTASGPVLGGQPRRQHHLATTSPSAPSSTGRWPRSGRPSSTSAGGSTSTASSPKGSPWPGRPASPRTTRRSSRYAELIGRPIDDLFYYEVFSGFRFAVIMCRLVDLMVESGQLRRDTDMGHNNLATQFLAQLLDLPSPAG